MNHIESNQCFKIRKSEIEEVRLKRSNMREELAKEENKDLKEFLGKFPGAGADTQIGQRQRYLGYIESSGSVNRSSSITGPRERALEGSNLSTKVPALPVQAIRRPGVQPGSLDTADFPTPAEAGIPKKRTGEKNDGASTKENASGISSSANDSGNAKLQHVSGPDQRPGSWGVKSFPAIAEASAHKGITEPEYHDGASRASACSEKDGDELILSKAKTLNDSRWAPNKTMATSSLSRQGQSGHFELHPIYDRDILNKRAERDQAGTVSDQGKAVYTQGRSLYVQESSVGPFEQSEVTSHFSAASEDTAGVSSMALPPHLRAKFLRQGATDCGQASIRPADDRSVRMLPPHLQRGLDAGSTIAKTEAFDSENDASTVKHSDMGTMGLLPTGSLGGRGVSALPPHLRLKMDDELKGTEGGGVGSESSDGGVRLEGQEKAGLAAANFAEATTTQLGPELSVLTGQSTTGGVNFPSEVEQIQPSRSGEALANSRRSSGLPPHLRVKSGLGVAVSPTKPRETDCSPTPSMSTGQSTPEAVGTGRESGMDELSTPRDNFGVVQSVKGYALMAKGNDALAPHLRTKHGQGGVLPTDQNDAKVAATDMALKSSSSASRNATTQTDGASAILGGVTLRPTDTSMGAVSTMNPDVEDVGLGPHDPQHPGYDARNYRSPYTGRFHCPFPLCG